MANFIIYIFSPLNMTDLNYVLLLLLHSTTDKVRYAYDGLKRQRLLEPMIRTNDTFEAVTWKKALRAAAAKLNSVSKACNYYILPRKTILE